MIKYDAIRDQLKKLQGSGSTVHMDVNMNHPKLHLTNAAAKITGVYSHLFQIEEDSTGKIRKHTIQYNELLTKNVVILELGEAE